MAIIHEESAHNISYEYYAPKENNKGNIKGIICQKNEKNSGKTKFKSRSNTQ